jgi:hypothetical protein
MDYYTGKAPDEPSPTYRQVTEKEKVEIWYVEPLSKMRGDDAFICLMVCFPLLEAIMRYELAIPDDQQVNFSDNSPALHWFSVFMTIPDAEARKIWDAFRNGLLHQAMIKGTVDYDLTGTSAGRPAKAMDGRITLYVWDLRDGVVEKLKKHHRKLWRTGTSTLPTIYIRGGA